MALSQQKALTAVREIFAGPRAQEAERLEMLYQALRPGARSAAQFTPTTQIPADAPPLMKELARKAETNYLPLLVKTFAQVMKVDGYYSKSDPEKVAPWTWWQRNRMDSRQVGICRGVLQYGTSYAVGLPGKWGRDQPGPAAALFSPRQMTAIYAQDDDEWPLAGVYVEGKHVVLLDETSEYRFGIEDQRALLAATMPTPTLHALNAGWLTFIERRDHDMGVCPIVRYRDRNLLAGEEQLGIVEPLITINERINETTFQMLVAQYFQAFKQRYIIGWVPKSEQEELKTGAALNWYLDMDPEKVKIGELEQGTTKGYIESRAAAIRDFSAIGQIPAQSLGIDGISNISDATLAGLEAAKNREADEITASLGESHEQLLRLFAFIDGNTAAADDYDSECRWRDYEARSFSQTVAGLAQLVQSLGLPPEIALEDVPGMTPQRLERAKRLMLRQRGRNTAARVIDRDGPAAG